MYASIPVYVCKQVNTCIYIYIYIYIYTHMHTDAHYTYSCIVCPVSAARPAAGAAR